MWLICIFDITVMYGDKINQLMFNYEKFEMEEMQENSWYDLQKYLFKSIRNKKRTREIKIWNNNAYLCIYMFSFLFHWWTSLKVVISLKIFV